MRSITREEFIAFYPQFAGFEPAFALSAFIDQANERFAAFTSADAEEARRLYTAHKLTMYARTALPCDPAPSMAQIAGAGQVKQRIAGKKAGEVSVTYAAGASSASAVSAAMTDLAETDYGIQLLGLVRLYGRSVYIP